ncbi:hypothetical protein ACVIGV_003617 [Rhizobium leguminosarum]
MDRHHRHFDGEGDQEGEEQPGLDRERQILRCQREDVEGLAAVEIEHDDTDEEQEAARQRVEEELERRIDPAFATPDADDQVHRDQHRFPENVEQEQVERAEHPQHQRLHGEQTDHERLDLAVDRNPRGEHTDRTQQRGQEHEERAYPVDTKRISDPERGHPRALLCELHLVGRGVESGQHGDAEGEVKDCDTQRCPAHRIVAAEKHQNRCPGDGRENYEAQKRQSHRAPYRHTTAKTTAAAITPAIIASA